ncbi:MAG: pyruvate, phosphate dikinase, partial [Proteobacteria bacterium]|nr:pyruvate, phosphate dikinase [Pseudomonadota bacterium]
GIPVNWSQISGASVIVETSLDNFPFDSSLGSHFFHNVTSMNIGYFSVPHNSDVEFIRWNTLEKQELINKTKYFRHVRFEKPLCVIMDGRKRTSAILVSDSDSIG